jgi:hypothetical protein
VSTRINATRTTPWAGKAQAIRADRAASSQPSARRALAKNLFAGLLLSAAGVALGSALWLWLIPGWPAHPASLTQMAQTVGVTGIALRAAVVTALLSAVVGWACWPVLRARAQRPSVQA